MVNLVFEIQKVSFQAILVGKYILLSFRQKRNSSIRFKFEEEYIFFVKLAYIDIKINI